MPKLKPWFHVVTPREDLRKNRPLDASEFAVNLDLIRDGKRSLEEAEEASGHASRPHVQLDPQVDTVHRFVSGTCGTGLAFT